MNEFTKEELEEIFYLIDDYQGMRGEFGRCNLYSKIQSMIDNYCDHHLINYCCGCDPENIVCDKCHKDLWGRKLS